MVRWASIVTRALTESGGNDYEQEYFSDGAEDHDDGGDAEEAY
jgi:hypothetical protein